MAIAFFFQFLQIEVGEVETKDTHRKKYTGPNFYVGGLCVHLFLLRYTILTHNISLGVTL